MDQTTAARRFFAVAEVAGVALAAGTSRTHLGCIACSADAGYYPAQCAVMAMECIDRMASAICEKRRTIMLILTRRVGETLMIGDNVTVTVLGVKGNQVRIGINAPKDLAVHREEIFNRIQKEKEAAAGHVGGGETGAG